jgi:hypothetical protein
MVVDRGMCDCPHQMYQATNAVKPSASVKQESWRKFPVTDGSPEFSGLHS